MIEHEIATLVGQRVVGIALGYEDLDDHDTLRFDPVMAILAGKLAAGRPDCAPVAGKSTLDRDILTVVLTSGERTTARVMEHHAHFDPEGERLRG